MGERRSEYCCGGPGEVLGFYSTKAVEVFSQRISVNDLEESLWLL